MQRYLRRSISFCNADDHLESPRDNMLTVFTIRASSKGHRDMLKLRRVDVEEKLSSHLVSGSRFVELQIGPSIDQHLHSDVKSRLIIAMKLDFPLPLSLGILLSNLGFEDLRVLPLNYLCPRQAIF